MTEDILDRAQGLLDFPGGEFDEEYGCDISNVIMELIAEVERLRAASAHELDLRDRHIESLEARIKELEADRIAFRNLGSRIEDLETYIERLEVAFLESEAENQFHQNYGESEWAIHPEEDFEGHWGRNRFRSEAREALERIRSGEKDD